MNKLSTKEAEERYGLNASHWAIIAPLIGGEKVGGIWLVPEDSVENYIYNLKATNEKKEANKPEAKDWKNIAYYIIGGLAVLYIAMYFGWKGVAASLSNDEGNLLITAWFFSISLYMFSYFGMAIFDGMYFVNTRNDEREKSGLFKARVIYPFIIISSVIVITVFIAKMYVLGMSSVYSFEVILVYVSLASFVEYSLILATFYNNRLYFESMPKNIYDYSSMFGTVFIAIVFFYIGVDKTSGLMACIIGYLMISDLIEDFDDRKTGKSRYKRIVDSIINIEKNLEFLKQQRESINSLADKVGKFNKREIAIIKALAKEDFNHTLYGKALFAIKVVVTTVTLGVLSSVLANYIYTQFTSN